MGDKKTIESLMEQGRISGKLSTKEITDVLEDMEYDVDQMENFYESCSNMNIEIIDDFSLETDLSMPLDGRDNLELALGVCKDDKTKEGIEMVLKNFLKVLEAEGIEQIDPVGEPFDPTFSEAIMAAPAAEGEEDGIVRQVCRKGYKKGDKVLRFAQVVVTKS